jgi:cell division protein FtsA
LSRKEDLIVGLDIGTTKICAVVAERTETGVDVVGIGTHPSRGLRKGVVVDIEATVESIKHAVEEAELMGDCEISSVYAGIAGGHIRGMNSHGIVAVKDREVSESDVRRVIDAAKAVAIPMDREVIHVIPQEFIIDDQDGIREPLGMSGVRLETKIHIVTAAVTSAQNIVKCANRAGLNVVDIVLEPLASAEAVLARDERDLGVCLIDIGGGTTDIAVFNEGSIAHTSVLALGGNHITNDLAVGLRTPFDEAERIKKKFGVASARLLGSDDILSVPSVGGRRPREVSRKLICDVIEPRADEILSLARQELVKSSMDERIPSGVVLSGGCSALAGIADLAEEIFEGPVRLGSPTQVGCLQDVVRDPTTLTYPEPLSHPRRLDFQKGQAAHARVVLRRSRLMTLGLCSSQKSTSMHRAKTKKTCRLLAQFYITRLSERGVSHGAR